MSGDLPPIAALGFYAATGFCCFESICSAGNEPVGKLYEWLIERMDKIQTQMGGLSVNNYPG